MSLLLFVAKSRFFRAPHSLSLSLFLFLNISSLRIWVDPAVPFVII